MAQKRSHEQFVAEMQDVNPEIRILGRYKGVHEHVKVQCRNCKRIWSANAGNLLHGAGCIDCSGYRNTKKTHEEFEAEIKEVLPQITLLGVYQDTKHKILCRCETCANEWMANPSTLRKGHGCPLCARKNLPGRLPISHEEFSSRIFAKCPSIKLTSKYTAAHNEISCHCKICGHDWKAIASALEKNCFCPACRKEDLKKKRAERFFKLVSEKFPTIEVHGEYKDSTTPMNCHCRKCGYEWNKPPVGLLRSSGCPACRKREITRMLTKTHEDYVGELQQINPNVEVIGHYTNSHTKLEFHCKACGNNWTAAPQSLLNRSGCPRCAISGTSFMEQFLYFALEYALGEDKVISRDKKAIGRELDIYLPEHRLAIEPGGWFWHKDKLVEDDKKRKLCHSKGIRLILIYDTVPIDIAENIQMEDCFLFTDSLAEEAKHKTLKELVRQILTFCDPKLKLDLQEEQWKQINAKALKYSKRMSHDEFVEEMDDVNPAIEITGLYIDRLTKIEAKCKVCFHEWSATPQNLLQGHNCPKCANKTRATKQTKTHERFVEELQQKRFNIKPLERYTHGNVEIRFQCTECGHIWRARPNKVLLSKGCPECSKRNRGIKRRVSPEEFKARIESINPNIELLEDYQTSRIKIRVKCRICGNIWKANPGGLQKGIGCPNWRHH